ncbi:DNA-protecting protein DprA [Thermosulfurimonas marina]|uniref:DNA-protecting protein DprA n=1 Tax=Thermosulfurimonas marina TaxID=2047767 RepID=A0A6H1WQB5_9BACT|nr:DNA-processing protein DprA [Thermosulfurimonas marina]QJA05381.1 DNA-protecting protein DprA [Thermosulfurimonas marina]
MEFPEERLALLGLAAEKGLAPGFGVPAPRALAPRGREILKILERLGAEPLFFEDQTYPSLLREIPDPPAFLLVKGRLRTEVPLVAVVGARKATAYGRRVAFEWSARLADSGVGIVSGLALGVDTEAHRGALSAGGYTVAVLGTGPDLVYPRDNRRLAEEILAAGGALISEYPPGARPERWRFPRRNRLISGLSLGVLVVEAAERSGALITARLALDQGREVMAVPGSIFSPQSVGVHQLLKLGAHPVTSPEEVLEILGLSRPAAPTPQGPDEPLSVEVSSLAQRVLAVLGAYPRHFDEILAETGLSVSELSEALLELEMEGLIQSLPGKFYQRY